MTVVLATLIRWFLVSILKSYKMLML